MKTAYPPMSSRILWHIDKNLMITEFNEIHEILEFSSFVYNVYKKIYKQQNNWTPDQAEQQEIELEDLHYASESHFFVCCTLDREIVGTCRITRKSDLLRFPIEKEFNIDLQALIQRHNMFIDEFWHFGRLAVDKDRLAQINPDPGCSTTILKELLVTSIEVMCRSKNNMLIAETDSKVFRMLNLMGINVEMVGLPKFYMGSQTLPTIVTASDLLRWSFTQKAAVHHEPV